jgi:hypothetical protein
MVHNPERPSVLADMNSHGEINLFPRGAMVEVDFWMNFSRSRVFKSAFVCRALKRCYVGRSGAKETKFRYVRVQ